MTPNFIAISLLLAKARSSETVAATHPDSSKDWEYLESYFFATEATMARLSDELAPT
jgi:hypothetical protein